MGNLWPIFRQIKSLLTAVDSQLFLAQNNLYANMAYLGFTYSNPIHSYFILVFLRSVWVWGKLLGRCLL